MTAVSVTVPVRCRVLVQHVIEVTVEVEQEGDLVPGQPGPFDHDRLQPPAVAAAIARVTVAGDVDDRAARLLGWECAPSAPGEPWRPYTFGGRIT